MDELSAEFLKTCVAIAARFAKAEVSRDSNRTIEQSCNRLMTTEFRPKLLSISAKLDQLLTQAAEILAEPVYADVYALAEKLYEVIVDMQARVEQHLDQHNHGGATTYGRSKT
jgi:hypothetical protein